MGISAILFQVLGTLVTIAGLVVVAPSAAGRAIATPIRYVRDKLSELRSCVARRLRRRPPDIHECAGTVHAHSRAFFNPMVRPSLNGSGTNEDRLVALERSTLALREEVTDLGATSHQLTTAITSLANKANAQHIELKTRIEADRVSSEVLNTRGFPLAAAGALLSGLPDRWLEPSGALLEVLFTLVALGTCAWALCSLWRALPDLVQGFRRQLATQRDG